MKFIFITLVLTLVLALPLTAAEKECINVFFDPGALDFDKLVQLRDHVVKKRITIRNARTGTLDLKLDRFFFTRVGNITLSDNEEIIGEGKSYSLEVTVTGDNPVGKLTGAVDVDDTIRVQGSLLPQRRNLCEIPVTAQILPVIEATPSTLDFGNVAINTSKTLNVTLKPNIVLKNVTFLRTSGISAVQPASFDTIIAGGTKDVQVTVSPTTVGAFTSSFSVIFETQLTGTVRISHKINVRGNATELAPRP